MKKYITNTPLETILNNMPETWLPLLVGGCVRDYILGKECKDIDIEVHNTDINTLLTYLKDYGNCDIVGKQYGVIKLNITGKNYDFSVPRREIKTGNGHRGFTISLDNVSFEEAFLRRDITINAIAFNPRTNLYVDPFNGKTDLKYGIIRATSSAFSEDIIRPLRIFQFVARFGFNVEPATIEMCKLLKNEFSFLAVERIYEEWQKFVLKGNYALKALQFLIDCEWIQFWPELNNLIGVQQNPDFHPEGDVFTHTAHVIQSAFDIAVREKLNDFDRAVLAYSAITHDMGKPSTTIYREVRGTMRWTAYGHEQAGVPFAEAFLKSIGVPRNIISHVLPHVAWHMQPHTFEKECSDKTIRKLSERLVPSNIKMLAYVSEADNSGRPPLPQEKGKGVEIMLKKAEKLQCLNYKQTPLVRGQDLIDAGMPPGILVGQCVKEAWGQQINGTLDKEKFIQKKTWMYKE